MKGSEFEETKCGTELKILKNDGRVKEKEHKRRKTVSSFIISFISLLGTPSVMCTVRCCRTAEGGNNNKNGGNDGNARRKL